MRSYFVFENVASVKMHLDIIQYSSCFYVFSFYNLQQNMAYCCSEIKHSLSLCSFYATCIKLETDFEMQMSFQQEVKSKRNPFPSSQKRLLKKNCTHDWFPWITHPLHHLRDTHVTLLLKKISPSACSILDIQSTSINTPISHQVSIMCLWKWWHECYRCCM